ncbi:MAG: hypothetical protein WC303_00855 [Candidatus Paceibacterota bacterium]|jgi:hypothetical protein
MNKIKKLVVLIVAMAMLIFVGPAGIAPSTNVTIVPAVAPVYTVPMITGNRNDAHFKVFCNEDPPPGTDCLDCDLYNYEKLTNTQNGLASASSHYNNDACTQDRSPDYIDRPDYSGPPVVNTRGCG